MITSTITPANCISSKQAGFGRFNKGRDIGKQIKQLKKVNKHDPVAKKVLDNLTSAIGKLKKDQKPHTGNDFELQNVEYLNKEGNKKPLRLTLSQTVNNEQEETFSHRVRIAGDKVFEDLKALINSREKMVPDENNPLIGHF
jgi:hypothetical protein